MSPAHIAGVGMTKFGKTPERTGRDLFAEAGSTAIDDAGIDREDVDALYLGNFMGELSENQGHMGPLMAKALGLDVPATRVESACASGGMAVRQGVRDVRNGEADLVVVGGVERMHNMGTTGATGGLSVAADDLWEIRQGITFPGAYALMAQRYFEVHGGDREDLAHVAVKNHENAANNPLAQYQSEISIEKVLEAPPVALPMGLFDSSPITDGAAAAVLVSEEYAAEHDLDAGVAITGTGQGTDNLALAERDSLVYTPATEHAADEAYEDAGIESADVDFAEVHDCFTIAEVLALEGLGFYEEGEGITAAREGETAADGELPVNLSGGLKAKGHPVGATGVAQITEMTKLFRGDHVNSDAVEDASVGLTHNAGGTVASAVVHVLEVAE
ncbi:thiolase domain-containing protein [Halapricum sp. CBA1109]|uniref:thiolase domain-containing protein n=1 Tax=Halapricum sp. CBA1109 TaxID=2668068 RepID=UPI0012FB8FB9|nr:thiolase domain-containing protein [Halapricum sp. CBA1109]MUV90890.1 thiolase domain-containing protein [Halapricum sp. CBA1109]